MFEINRSKETSQIGVDTAQKPNKIGIKGKTIVVKPAGISGLKRGSI
jgi:hypothetical protein